MLAPGVRELHSVLTAETFPPASTCLVRCRAAACCVKGAAVPAGAVQKSGRLWWLQCETVLNNSLKQLPSGLLAVVAPLFGCLASVQPGL